ncbi:Fibronectin type-III domain-containing protein [Caenorhabditis elegans]|uniref:Fibronectin type-III domain-containing protein n=1 Tax=Caenorhabditis elegans TaxID=6239 RepID=A0A486WX36_CAEEL|nr:Fibronectin type-III domain-containing protein [Caenorhabditis elegans]VGM69606.1 Fibronectin type-III domain-containing protein [Caenorhabditis elegans]
MATFACVSLPPQFITPPPSTSNCTQHIDSDSGSSTGTSGGDMKTLETLDDGGSTSSHQTSPEYPSPPPPSNSPPESMASLQAESPIEDEDARHEMTSTEGTSSTGTGSPQEPKTWISQPGYHPVPISGPLPRHPQSILFVHVNDGEILQLHQQGNNEVVGNLLGPGTVRMIGEPGMTNQPLPIQLRHNQQCHQFVDEEVPQLVGSQQLLNAIGGTPTQNGPGTSSSRGSGRGNHGGGRRNYGNQRSLHTNNNESGQHSQNGHSGHRNVYSRGNYRGNKYNSRGRMDYHGKARNDNPSYMANNVQELPELAVNTHGSIDSNVQVTASTTQDMVTLRQPTPVMTLPPPPQQRSLLGEPSGPPMGEMQPIVHGIPSAQSVNFPPPGLPLLIPSVHEIPRQDLSVMPAMMNGSVQSTMMQDPMMPGTSMGMNPQMFGVPPPPPGMMILSTDAAFNNNKWIPYQTLGENERLLKVLSTLRPIRVANTLTTEMEFLYTPLKINDYRFEHGICLFGPIENSDVSYHATVFDLSGIMITTVILEVNKSGDDIVSNLFRVQSLHPNTTYKINMKAVIIDRGLHGQQTDDLCFRTAPGRPEPPTEVEILSRGLHFIELVWKTAINNGAFISHYHVYIHENELEDGRMMQTAEEKIQISNLIPQTCYKIRIHSINALGESMEGYELDVWTKPNSPPLAPENISVFAQSHRSIRVSWDKNPNCTIWIEVYNCASGKGGYARENFGGDQTVIGELDPDTEYQMRVIARNEFGEGHSEYINMRTQKYRKSEHPSRFRQYSDDHRKVNYDRSPSTPFFVRFVDNCPEMAWKNFASPQDEISFLVEGSTFEMPEKYIQLYRGNSSSLIVLDSKMHYIRVINIFKKGQRSPPSERAVIPREYFKYRPEKITDVKISLRSENCVLVKWQTLDIKSNKLPETSKIIYYVQRCDLTENQVLCAGEEDHCFFDNIPGETTISVQVRAAVSFHDALTHGDWSVLSHFTTPRGLPSPVINAKFNVKCSTLYWDCLDKSTDLQYTVHIRQLPTKRDLLKVTTKAKNIVLDSVQPGEKYSVTLISLTTVGKSKQRTELEINVPALKPSAPEDVAVSQVQIDRCTVSWTAAEGNGSPIIGYVVRMMLNGELFSEHFVTESENETNYRHVLKYLDPNTEYLINIAAKNSVGFSEKIEAVVKTVPLCPTIPKIWCDCEATALKIHWDRVTSGNSMMYKLMKINKNAQQVTLYEGENNTAKVKSLKENTKYVFKLRVSDRATGASTWSESFSFSTTTAPPPPLKKSPSTALVSGHSYLYRIEWENCLPDSSQHYYRLQIADATVKGAKWQLCYEGRNHFYELNTETYPGALHVRVMCVRKHLEEELKGSPSPVGYIGNVPPTIESVKNEEIHQKSRLHLFTTDRAYAYSLLVLLIFLFLMILSFSEKAFEYITGMPIEKLSSGNAATSPPSSKPPQ